MRNRKRTDRIGVPIQVIEGKIYLIRSEQVMLDSDLSTLYGVTTKQLNQQVRRNRARFPSDFMFQLTSRETTILRSQFVTSSGHGGRRYRPLAFTEQGVAMLSSVLSSERAIQVNIAIMRTFAKLRRLLSSNKDLAAKLKQLEKKYDSRFNVVFDAIRKLMEPQVIPPQRRIGFR